MQNHFYCKTGLPVKILSLLLAVFSPLYFLAQDISGLYTGVLTNDSTGRKQNFELALSEYKGKITGYSYTTFIANDTFYYSIKRVEAERENGFLVVKDVKMENNNFPENPAKKVRQTAFFPLINDSTIDVSRGRWETNRTKLYYSIGGKAELEKKEDDKESSLLAHLGELGIESNIAFDSHKKVKYQDEKKDIAKNEKPKKPEIKAESKAVVAKAEPKAVPVKAIEPAAPNDIAITTAATPVVKAPEPKPVKADAPVQPAIVSAPPPPVVTEEIKTTGKPITPAVVGVKPEPASPAPVKVDMPVQPTLVSAPPPPVVKEETKFTGQPIASAKAEVINEPVVKNIPKETKTNPVAQPTMQEEKPIVKTSPVIAKTEPLVNNKPAAVVKTEPPVVSVPKKEVSAPAPEVKKTPTASVAKATAAPTPVQPGNSQPAVKKAEPAVVAAVPALPEKKETIVPIAVTPVVNAVPQLKAVDLPIVVATRKNEVVQQLTFKNDSLVIALYDNGVVDGDSVSVYVNGMPVLEKTMLKVSATKKTIYTTSYADSIQIVLFAENLGTIAPNTGLMTIRDGEEVYQVRFSADLKQNAAITLRRKR